ncbi:MAG: DUF402 domain-containing protein [Chloroflexota bacterium]|nr:DUF402 domain-containing protein [Chloroflexota bacterium]
MSAANTLPRMTVVKCDAHGAEGFRYDGEIVEQSATHVYLRAIFTRADSDRGYMVYRRGDVFHEWFYADRWYNVFKIFDVDDGRLKGWYCNITRPATFNTEDGRLIVRADDLELDIFVFPPQMEREPLLLDEREFNQLELSDDEQRMAWAAVDTITDLAARGVAPFDAPANERPSE